MMLFSVASFVSQKMVLMSVKYVTKYYFVSIKAALLLFLCVRMLLLAAGLIRES